MKRILLLSLLLLPIVALAQYPTFSNKQKLGVQTTGDGLIYRGNSNPNYNPSNINNAYFYLDTTASKLYLYSVGNWQQVYPSPQFDTTTLNVYLKISDTTAMLLPYFRDSDTTSLNLINRFALKLNISDTATMLTPYLRKADTISLSNRISLKLNISDTTILSNRITTNANNIIIINNKLNTKLDTIYKKLKNVVTRVLNKDTLDLGGSLTEGFGINIIGDSINIDTTIIFTQSDTITLSNRIDNKLNISDTVSLSNRIDLKLNKTDTINLSNRIDLKLNKSDTISLSNRIDIKLNASDTVSLSNRINKKLDTLYVNYQTSIDTIVNKDTINITSLEAGAGINITNNVISLDTTLLDSVVRVQNIYVKNDENTTLLKGEAVYVTGANGTNILVKRASNIAESSSSKTLGLTMTSIPSKGFGYVIKEGLLAGLNTNSADSAGVPIWLGVNGALIYGLNNKPYAPNHLVYLGVVTRKNPNVGEVYVTVQNGFEIKELHDVQIIDPANKASLYYNSSQNLWRDTTAALLVSDTVSMLNPYLRKLDTITLSNRINLKFNTADTSILGYVTTYSNQYNINGNKTFNNTVSVDSLNSTKQAKIQSLTVGKGGYITVGGGSGGISSTAFGFEALKNNTIGDWNTAIGYQSLLSNTTAWSNVAIGNNALKYNTTGEYNTAIGTDALDLNIVGNYNTAIGYNSGNGSKGSNNIFIGYNTSHTTDSINNTLMIGGVNTPLLSGIITGNKKLGINKNPLTLTHTFEVNSPISDAVKISSNTNSTNLELANNSNNSVFIKSSNKNMTLQTDTTALVYLKGDVNRVGILTMSPEQALEVAGTIRVDSLGSNTLTPTKLVGANDVNDLSDVKLGTGLFISNDTLKLNDNIINLGDTATLLRQDFIPLTSNQVIWTQGNKKLLKYFTQVYRNGQLLKDVQYTISSDSIVTIEEGSYKLGDIITVIAIDNIVALAGSGSMITLQGDVTGNGISSITTTIGANKVTNTMLAGSISDSKLNTITTVGKVSNSATTATDVNTANHIVLRDATGNFSAGTITASLNGNANTSTTLATGRTIGITGDLTYTSPSFNGSANVTAVGTLANSGVTANTYTAATIVVDAKGRITSASSNTIPTVNNGTLTMAVSGNGLTGSQTFTANQSSAATFTINSTATSNNTENTIVYRDAYKDFSARNITASNFYGLASTATISNGVQSFLTTGIIKLATVSNAVQPTITVPDVNAIMARTDAAQTFTGTQIFSSTINGSITGNAATVTTNANLTGDVTSTGNSTTLASVGTAGTYRSVTTDIKGRVTAGTNPTTLSGYGITDAVPSNRTITINGTAQDLSTNRTFNVGTVTSVGGTGTVSGLTLTGTVSSTGNLTLGGTLSLTSGNVTTALGYTPYNSTNPNGYITSSALSSYLPLSGGTLTGTLNGTNQNLSNILMLSDNSTIYNSVTTGPSTSEAVRFGLNQNISGGANIFMGGNQELGGNAANPSIFFTDSRQAYASINGIYTAGASSNKSGHIVFNTTPNDGTTALTERMRISQDGSITMGGTLGVTSNITANSFIKSGGTSSQFLKANGSVDGTSYLPLTGGTLSNTQNNTLTINSVAANFNPNIALVSSASSPGYHYSNTGIRGVGQTISTSGIGVQGEATQTDMNGFGSAFGIQGIVNGTGAGGNGSTYGGYFTNTTTVAGNNYGLYVTTASGGDYGIYQTGTGTNYFGSNTGIGGKLDVSSGIDVSGNFSTSYHTNVSALFRGYQVLVAPNNDYGQTRIHFPNRPVTEGFSDFGSGIRHKFDGSDARNSFTSLYTSSSANLQIDAVSINSSGNVGIRDTTPSYTLDVNGTLGVTGTTTLSNLGSVGTGVVVTSNTGLLSTATTVGQTGIMTTGNWSTSTGASVATFDVTHNLGVEPSSVIITPQTINGGATKIFYEVIGKTNSYFRVQAFNLTTGSPATNTAVSIYWIAIK